MNYFKKCICAQLDSGNFLVLCDRNTISSYDINIKSTRIGLYKLDVITRDLVINFPSDLDDEAIFKFIRTNQGGLRLIDYGYKWGFGLVDHRFNDPAGPVLVAVSELFLPIDQFIESNPSDFNKFVDLDKEKQEYSKSKDNNSTTINIDDHPSFSNDAVLVDDIREYVDSSIQTLENSISNDIADVKDNVSRIEENNNIITKRIEESITTITKNIKLLTIYLILIAALVVILIFAVKYISTHTVKDDIAISSNDITTATDTLSKCPICGSEANVHISYNSNDGTKYCSINCSNIYCGLSIEYQDAEEAFKKWNSLQYND